MEFRPQGVVRTIMHSESLKLMKDFVDKYLDPNRQLKILDVGSMNIGGGTTYRGLFASNPNWIYAGGDLIQGDNVDIVFKEPYNWGLSEQYDVIISGQTLEHVEDTHKWILEIKKYLKPSGLVCIIVPNCFNEHRYPVDCWRVFPDGMRFLLKEIGSFEILDVYKYLNDTIGVAKNVKV